MKIFLKVITLQSTRTHWSIAASKSISWIWRTSGWIRSTITFGRRHFFFPSLTTFCSTASSVPNGSAASTTSPNYSWVNRCLTDCCLWRHIELYRTSACFQASLRLFRLPRTSQRWMCLPSTWLTWSLTTWPYSTKWLKFSCTRSPLRPLTKHKMARSIFSRHFPRARWCSQATFTTCVKSSFSASSLFTLFVTWSRRSK